MLIRTSHELSLNRSAFNTPMLHYASMNFSLILSDRKTFDAKLVAASVMFANRNFTLRMTASN